MTSVVRALLAAHLFCATGATAAFWATALTRKGSPTHRALGRWFARLIYGAATTGGVLAVIGVAAPSLMVPFAAGADAITATRHLMWLILYLLLIIVAPVQHGLAAVAAGPLPMTARSRGHAVLNIGAIAGSVLVFPASLVWHAWTFLIVVPIGFIVGLRNMRYASRTSATPLEWQREHLTSVITAGITLHTAFFVLSALRWPSLLGATASSLAPWLLPAAVGLPTIMWLRRRPEILF